MQTSNHQQASSVIHRRRTCLGLCAVLVLGSAVAVPSRADTAAATDISKQKQTVVDMRKVGTAFMSWLADQVGGDAVASVALIAEEDPRPRWTLREKNAETLHSYSLITYATISELLVPNYIDAVPEKDRWGHPYQFALNADLLGSHVLGIRSAGRDGRFETDDYVIGGFAAVEFDRDLVWGDGYFMRWPTVRTTDV